LTRCVVRYGDNPFTALRALAVRLAGYFFFGAAPFPVNTLCDNQNEFGFDWTLP
jgi:hypothetical protein